jgi:hypothetical protein
MIERVFDPPQVLSLCHPMPNLGSIANGWSRQKNRTSGITLDWK